MEQLLKIWNDTQVVSLFNKAMDRLYCHFKTLSVKDRERFRKYLETTYNNFSRIKPIGFSYPLDFLDIYVPLHLKPMLPEQDDILIDNYPVTIFNECSHVLIVDNAGMGKSTIAKRIFIGACQYIKSENEKKKKDPCGIPIFVELQKITQENDIVTQIRKQIGGLSSAFDGNVLKYLFEHGKFLFIFDGFDEIKHSEKDYVCQSLLSFVNKLPNSSFVITSRQDDALCAFQMFSSYSIKRLNMEEAFRIIINLDKEKRKLRSKMLVSQLSAGDTGIEDFLTNPLLVTILFVTYDYKEYLPSQKHMFYEQVYDALYQGHNLTKRPNYVGEKRSGLLIDEFERVLRCMGFLSVTRQKVEFSRDEIIELIKKTKMVSICKNFDPLLFLDDLIHAVPLFLQEGHSYKWIHKSLSEFFAMKYLAVDAMDKEGEFAMKLYEGVQNQNLNLFELYYGIKPSGFNQYLMLPALLSIKDILLPNNAEIEKKLFSTYLLGRSMIISKRLKGKTSNNIVLLDLDALSFFVYVTKNENSKWHTILNIICKKHPELIRKNAFETKLSGTSVDDIHNAIAVILNDNEELVIDSNNIMDIDSYRLSRITTLLSYFGKPIIMDYYLTKEDCERIIQKVREDIKNKNDFF